MLSIGEVIQMFRQVVLSINRKHSRIKHSLFVTMLLKLLFTRNLSCYCLNRSKKENPAHSGEKVQKHGTRTHTLRLIFVISVSLSNSFRNPKISNLFIQFDVFGIKKSFHVSGMNLPFYPFINMVIKLSVVIIEECPMQLSGSSRLNTASACYHSVQSLLSSRLLFYTKP